jgi:hypothetical protein
VVTERAGLRLLADTAVTFSATCYATAPTCARTRWTLPPNRNPEVVPSSPSPTVHRLFANGAQKYMDDAFAITKATAGTYTPRRATTSAPVPAATLHPRPLPMRAVARNQSPVCNEKVQEHGQELHTAERGAVGVSARRWAP